jgi:protein associated with RNAse G/E
MSLYKHSIVLKDSHCFISNLDKTLLEVKEKQIIPLNFNEAMKAYFELHSWFPVIQCLKLNTGWKI